MGKQWAGRPLIAVMAVLSGWVAIRASVWEPPFDLPSPGGLLAKSQTGGTADKASQTVNEALLADAFVPGIPRESLLQRLDAKGPALPPWAIEREARYVTSPGLAFARPAALGSMARSRLSAGHQLLYAAAFAYVPPYLDVVGGGPIRAATPGRGQPLLPQTWRVGADGQSGAQPPAGATAVAMQGPEIAPKPDRWSGDAWLLVRENGSGARLASVNPAAYGSNQVGAVVRYSLAPGTPLDPQVYGRASKALVAGGESEAAVGANISLTDAFPLRVHGELRVTDRPGGTEVRPAAYVVTGLPRQEVAPGLIADSYVQAGYVGGDFETGFVDGKATLEAPVIRSDYGSFAIGGGVWGGAQRDASRLDVGPSATAILSTGKATVRASIDYRVRVAGDASPGDGVAVTLAASF